MGVAWGFDGANGVDARPTHKEGVSPWARDETVPGAGDGTRLTASIFNRLIGNIRQLALASGVPLTETSDADIANCISGMITTALQSYPTSGAVNDAIAAAINILASNVDASKAPIDSPAFTGTPTTPTASPSDNSQKIASTAYVDSAIALLSAVVSGALVFKGSFDASSGAFPGAGAAQTGWFYKVSVAGTVDGVSFSVGDDVFAIDNNASATTYVANWLKIEGVITFAEVIAALGFTPLNPANNLLDVANAATARTNLGLGALAVLGSVPASLISDASANGRSLIQAADFAAMRASAALNIDSVRSIGDAAATLVASDRVALTSAALTAARTWTLPAANAVNPGQKLVVADLAQGVSNTNALTIQRAGTDTINGGTSVALNVAGGAFILWSDGVSKWTAQAIGGQLSAQPDASTSTKGIALLASNSEALGGTDAGKIVTSAGLASSKSIGTNGYMKLPGGLIIQWGQCSGAAGTTVNFPVAFPNNAFACVLGCGIVDRTWAAASLSTTGFLYTITVASSGGAASSGAFFIAIGN